MRSTLLTWALSAGLGVPVAAGVTDAYLTLEVAWPARPGFVPEAAPLRLVVLKNRRVYVGGTRSIAAGLLSKKELKKLLRRVKRLKKVPGLGTTTVSLGGTVPRFRLWASVGKGLEVTATGDPRHAPLEHRQLAEILSELAEFNHPSLRRVAPAGYLAMARPENLPGGCRKWDLKIPLSTLLGGPRRLATEDVRGWPTGAVAASVCAPGQRVSVNFRPLLPGETP